MPTIAKQGLGLSRSKKTILTDVGDDMAAELQELAGRNGSVGEIFRVLNDGMGATMYVRAPNGSGEGYTYASVPDHHARLASANLLAKVLRITPEASGSAVQVNVGAGGDGETINVTASERLSELEAAGGSREPIIAAVEGLLATLKGGTGKA